jgi:hypothetical protein
MNEEIQDIQREIELILATEKSNIDKRLKKINEIIRNMVYYQLYKVKFQYLEEEE